MDQKSSNAFVRNLNFLMARRGISQADLAAKLGVSSAIVSNWCTGKKNPRMDNVARIAEILNATIGQFTDEDSCDDAVCDIVSSLSGEESELLDLYRAADPIYQGVAKDILREHPRKQDGKENTA
jgi:transcriptional regulator with XRE-family HTH domain